MQTETNSNLGLHYIQIHKRNPFSNNPNKQIPNLAIMTQPFPIRHQKKIRFLRNQTNKKPTSFNSPLRIERDCTTDGQKTKKNRIPRSSPRRDERCRYGSIIRRCQSPPNRTGRRTPLGNHLPRPFLRIRGADLHHTNRESKRNLPITLRFDSPA